MQIISNAWFGYFQYSATSIFYLFSWSLSVLDGLPIEHHSTGNIHTWSITVLHSLHITLFLSCIFTFLKVRRLNKYVHVGEWLEHSPIDHETRVWILPCVREVTSFFNWPAGSDGLCGTFGKWLKYHNTDWPKLCEWNWFDNNLQKSSTVVLEWSHKSLSEFQWNGLVQTSITEYDALFQKL